MRLGIDLDGVVADFNSGWMRHYGADFGVALTPEDARVWNGIPDLTHFADMRAFWEWAEQRGTPSFFRHLDLFEGATDALEDLSKVHDLVILTGKPDWAVHDTYSWIAEHGLPTREVHVPDDKWLVPCDIYLDDSPEQLAELARFRPEAEVCRFVRPWNTSMPGVRDIDGWPAFTRFVGHLTDQSVGASLSA
mgnify:FL=1